jgi:tetratricopeptide (TPR) repeat protein
VQKSVEEIECLLLECKRNLNISPLSAEENALKALDLSSKSGFEQGRFDSLLTISCIRNDMNQKERAIKTLEECLRIAKELKDPEREAKALMTLGTVYHEMKIYSEALENFLGAHKAARDSENTELECLADNNAASVF